MRRWPSALALTVLAIWGVGVLTLPCPQASAQTNSAPASDQKAQVVIDELPILSARAAAMGGALSTIADDLDATQHNPAGIGGYHGGSTKAPWLRKLYFPWFGVSANEASSDLNGEFRAQGGASDSNIGHAIIDAHAGKRQYGRANFLGGLTLGRTIIVPFSDHQVAAVSKGESSGQIDLRYRRMSGIGYGFSTQDTSERLSLGYFGAYTTRTETHGSFDYNDIISRQARSRAIQDNTLDYGSALTHNAGMRWRFGKTAAPSVAVALTNLGDTRYQASKAPSGDEPQELLIKQDMTIGFSVTPEIGRFSNLSLLVEGGKLLESDTSIAEKFRTGIEWAFGGYGSYAFGALRAGYNSAGASYGGALYLGLINIELASQAVDLGVGNEKVIERRLVSTLYVNVADF